MQYYRHEKSNRTFRSTVEVVNFLLYEVYPDKPKPKKARQAETEADNSVSSRFKTTCLAFKNYWKNYTLMILKNLFINISAL